MPRPFAYLHPGSAIALHPTGGNMEQRQTDKAAKPEREPIAPYRLGDPPTHPLPPDLKPEDIIVRSDSQRVA